jgi:hypothetical protein
MRLPGDFSILKDMIFDVSAWCASSRNNNQNCHYLRQERACRRDVGFKVRVLADPVPSHWLQSPPGRRAMIQLAKHN